jgi:hypothetical protein
MLIYFVFEKYTFNIELVDVNKSHLLTFLKSCEDKHLIKCKFDTLNTLIYFGKNVISKIKKFPENYFFTAHQNSQGLYEF